MQQQTTSRRLAWRTVDIVTASVIAVAAGVIFWAYGVAWSPIEAGVDLLLPGLKAAPASLWVFAGVLGGLVIRKPGAALYTELIAATVSALLGAQWGLTVLESGLLQGLGAELVFAIFLYRRWNIGVAMLAGMAAALMMAINDLALWYPGYEAPFKIAYLVSALAGGAVLAGLLPWWIMRALARAGALQRFAAGQHVAVVE